jgi:hypothetical protein
LNNAFVGSPNAFTLALQKNAKLNGANALFYAFVLPNSLRTTVPLGLGIDMTTTPNPTLAPTSILQQEDSIGIAVGSAVGGFCVLCMIAGIIYSWRRRKMSKEAFDEWQRVQEKKATDAGQGKRRAGASMFMPQTSSSSSSSQQNKRSSSGDGMDDIYARRADDIIPMASLGDGGSTRGGPSLPPPLPRANLLQVNALPQTNPLSDRRRSTILASQNSPLPPPPAARSRGSTGRPADPYNTNANDNNAL